MLPGDEAEARELILSGLEEHFGWRDESRNPDLDEIAATYADATFLVATVDDSIIGTGVLRPPVDGAAEIVRMSVRADYRRRGVGTAIVRELVRYATAAGVRRIVLETNADWHEVVEFYRSCGFELTHYENDEAHLSMSVG